MGDVINKLVLSVSISAIILIVLHGVWLTYETYENRVFRYQGDRYTVSDAARDRAEMLNKLHMLEVNQKLLMETRDDVRKLIRQVDQLNEVVRKQHE